MQNNPKKIRDGSKSAAVWCLAVLLVYTQFGCASTRKTTTTETTVTNPNKGVIYRGGQQTTTTVTTTGDQPKSRVVETSETVTTTTDTKSEHPGVLGSTLHAIGYVISLPFIIIGGIFRIIFGG